MIPWWVKWLALAAAALFLVGLKHHYDENRRDEGRAEVQARWDIDKATRIKAFTDQTTQWITEKLRADALAKEKQDARNIEANRAHARVAALPAADADARFPASSVVLLNDLVAASAKTPGATGEPLESPTAAPADSTVRAVTDWGVTCIALYNDARDAVIGWIDYYQRLRAAQPKEVTP